MRVCNLICVAVVVVVVVVVVDTRHNLLNVAVGDLNLSTKKCLKERSVAL